MAHTSRAVNKASRWYAESVLDAGSRQRVGLWVQLENPVAELGDQRLMLRLSKVVFLTGVKARNCM
jgi:hypothetical protein